MADESLRQPRNANGTRRPYHRPDMVSEQLFEVKAMACGKIGTGQPASDCDQNFQGPNSAS